MTVLGQAHELRGVQVPVDCGVAPEHRHAPVDQPRPHLAAVVDQAGGRHAQGDPPNLGALLWVGGGVEKDALVAGRHPDLKMIYLVEKPFWGSFE